MLKIVSALFVSHIIKIKIRAIRIVLSILKFVVYEVWIMSTPRDFRVYVWYAKNYDSFRFSYGYKLKKKGNKIWNKTPFDVVLGRTQAELSKFKTLKLYEVGLVQSLQTWAGGWIDLKTVNLG